MRNYIYLTAAIVVYAASSCSGSTFNSAAGGKEDDKSTATEGGDEGKADGDVTGDDASDDGGDTYRAIPPTETNGAYLTCEAFNTSGTDVSKPATVGCNAFKVDASLLNLEGAETKWKVTDKDGADVVIEDAPVPGPLRYQKAFYLDHAVLGSGYTPTLTVNGTVAEEASVTRPTVGDVENCAVMTMPGDKIFRACTRIVPNTPAVPVTITDLGLGEDVANYDVTVFTLDPATGVCGPDVLSEMTEVFLRTGTDTVEIEARVVTAWTAQYNCFRVTAKASPDVVIYLK